MKCHLLHIIKKGEVDGLHMVSSGQWLNDLLLNTNCAQKIIETLKGKRIT